MKVQNGMANKYRHVILKTLSEAREKTLAEMTKRKSKDQMAILKETLTDIDATMAWIRDELAKNKITDKVEDPPRQNFDYM